MNSFNFGLISMQRAPVVATAAGGFTPPATTFAWYKADAIQGLSNDDPVSTWSDSFSDKNLTGSGSTRPLYKTNLQNGLPGVRFDGTDDTMQSAAFTTVAQPSTYYLVANVRTNVDSYLLDGDSARNFLFYANSSGKIRQFAGSFTDGTLYGSVNTVVQITAIFDGASSEVYVDGSSSGTGNPGSQGLDRINLVGGTAIDYFEILADHVGTRNTSVESYLRNKWNTA